MPKRPFTIERPHRNVARVRFDVPKSGKWERWALFRTDAHWDNPHCNRAMERKHLDEAVERGAVILDNGDLFCAMQARDDKRAHKEGIRPEHNNDNYLGSLTSTAADYYRPYLDHIAKLGKGNHETAVEKKKEYFLTNELAAKLGKPAIAGGYTNWIQFAFKLRGTQGVSKHAWMGHGWGGGGPVTKNMIQLGNRVPVMLDNVDLILGGHVHEAWQCEVVRAGVNSHGNPYQRTVYIVQGSTYKDEYGDGAGGWHVETGKPPKPLGAWWIRFYNPTVDSVQIEIRRAS